MHAYLQTLVVMVLTLVLVSAADVSGTETPTSDCPSKQAPAERSIGLKSASDLRGNYYSSAEEGDGTPVGRLSVLLLDEEEDPRQVSLHHRFHTGDAFRFVVSSNQDGWLYVLHRSPDDEPQLLWPVSDEENHNRVRTGRKLTVPPSPGKFIFDDEVGDEYFYVVINSERRPPQLAAIKTATAADAESFEKKPLSPGGEAISSDRPETSQTTPFATPKQRIVQFSIRGSKRPIRGVVFDPGPQDTDPNIYFSTYPEDDAVSNVFEFQLRHER